jgi:hypothetical protein
MVGIVATEGEGDRDGIGGRPYLRDGRWPVCANASCKRNGQALTHYLRFDVRAEWGTRFAPGTHFSLFQCVACGDAFLPPPAGVVRPGAGDAASWGWWSATIEPPGAPLVRAEAPEPLVAPKQVSFGDVDRRGMRIGGDGPTPYTCACGEALAPLVTIPADLPFPTLPGAPEQTGTYSSKKYRVFLGNHVDVLACPKGCVVIPLNR